MNPSNIWPDAAQSLSAEDKTQLLNSLQNVFDSHLSKQRIEKNKSIQHDFEHVHLPMACWLANQHKNKTLLIGLNGAQGSGKSTLASLLADLIEAGFNKSVLSLSLDDFYLTRSERRLLSKDIHPLLLTRGVPGTHDIELATSVIHKLKQPINKPVAVPIFDKAADDRVAECDWRMVDTKPDIIIFEGWCVGSQAESDETLAQPVNELEKELDKEARWRQYANEQLKQGYKTLFSAMDIMLMLKIPDFSKVMAWRSLQEKKLRQSLSVEHQNTMNDIELKRFIMHFERITRNTLKQLPDTADIVISLGEQHRVVAVDVDVDVNVK